MNSTCPPQSLGQGRKFHGPATAWSLGAVPHPGAQHSRPIRPKGGPSTQETPRELGSPCQERAGGREQTQGGTQDGPGLGHHGCFWSSGQELGQRPRHVLPTASQPPAPTPAARGHHSPHAGGRAEAECQEDTHGHPAAKGRARFWELRPSASPLRLSLGQYRPADPAGTGRG